MAVSSSAAKRQAMEKLDELEQIVTEIENVLNNATKKADSRCCHWYH